MPHRQSQVAGLRGRSCLTCTAMFGFFVPPQRSRLLPAPGRRFLLASPSCIGHDDVLVSRAANLPGEGKLYDPVGIGNFLDLEKNKLTASLSKSFKSNILSRMLDADLPTKVTFGGKLGHLWVDGFNFNPIGKVGLTIRLLDLGASDSRQAGFLRFKAAARTNGKTDHGFEIDRRVAVFNLPSTTLYGNVTYKTNNKAEGVWKSNSSFGVHQDFKVGALRFAGRLGMTPEGNAVYDLRL